MYKICTNTMNDIVEGIKTLEQCLFGVFFAVFREISLHCSSFSIANFEQILYNALVFPLLTLNKFDILL